MKNCHVDPILSLIKTFTFLSVWILKIFKLEKIFGKKDRKIILLKFTGNIGRTLDHEMKGVFFYVNPLNVRRNDSVYRKSGIRNLQPVRQFLVCFSAAIVRSRKIYSHFSLFDTSYLKNIFEVFLLLGRAYNFYTSINYKLLFLRRSVARRSSSRYALSTLVHS